MIQHAAHNTTLPDELMETIYSHEGTSLAELSHAAPVLMVFLRHLGCTFCRQTLADLQGVRRELEARGVVIALVHMAEDEEAAEVFARYGLNDVPRFSDGERRLYRLFGLRRATISQLFGPPNFRRAFEAGVLERQGMGLPKGNLFQMPGVFLVDQGRIVAGQPHVTVGDRPDYQRLVQSSY